MNDGLDKEIYLGVVFDLNNSQIEGRWIVEAVKAPFMDIASKLGLSGRIYVGGFEDLPRTHGESVFQISTYNNNNSDLPKKLRDVFAGVGVQDAEKFVFIVTNRLLKNQIHHYQKALKMNQLKNYNNKVYILYFGEDSQNFLIDLAKEYNTEFIQITSLKILSDFLNRTIITGG